MSSRGGYGELIVSYRERRSTDDGSKLRIGSR